MAKWLSQLCTNLKELEAGRIQLLRDHTDMALNQFSKAYLPSSDHHSRNPFATPQNTTGHDRQSTPWAPRYGPSGHQLVFPCHRDSSPPHLRDSGRYYRYGSPSATNANFHQHVVPSAPQPRHTSSDPRYRRSALPLRHGTVSSRYGTGRSYHRDYSPPRGAQDLNLAMIAMLPKPKLMEFSSQFRSMLHDVVRDDAHRLAILRMYLTPKVLVKIGNSLFDPSMYRSVLHMLEHTYGMPEMVATKHLDQLLRTSAISDHDKKGLVDYIIKPEEPSPL